MAGEGRKQQSVSNALMEDVEVYAFLAQSGSWKHTQRKCSQGREVSSRVKLEESESCPLRKGARGI